jgi:putative ABC transport system permease protein
MLGRIGFFITHSLNDLRVNKQRSLFALLCIAAGVAAMVSLQTLGVMINETLTGSLQESNRGDLRITPNRSWPPYATELKDALFSNVAFTPQGVQHVRDWLDENYPGTVITYRQPLNGFGVGWSASIPERDTDKTFIMSFIVEASQYPVYGKVKSTDGKTLKDMLQGPNDIVLSQNLADDLDARVGDTVRISGASESFTLRGIVPADSEAGFSGSGMGLLAGLFGFYYLDVSATPLFEGVVPGQAAELYVRLADPSQVDQVQTRLDRQLPAVDTASTTDLADQNSILSERIDDMVVVMGLVSLLIGGIGIVNTMLVIVGRRTTEVAVLKTLGLEPAEIVVLFLVEAILMGVVGSLLGIVGGWGLAYLTKGFAENFLGQSMVFKITARPAVNGFVVGMIMTAIFGFLPTLAAGQIRPANVLRPSDTVVPRTGRLSALAAVMGLVMALSLVAQGLLGDLLSGVDSVRQIATGIGAGYGLLIAVPLILGDILSLRRRRRGWKWVWHLGVWLVLLVGLTAGGALFGRYIPALLILTGTAVFVCYLYILFWLIIWAAGGGRVSEIWPGILVLLFPAFWPLIPVLIVIVLPVWLLGRLIQRFSWVDLKIAMRGMLSTKARGASTLLALVIGIFTLSVITMLVDTITTAFEKLLEDVTGGNVLILSATGSSDTLSAIRTKLVEEGDSLRSFAIIGSYDARLTDYQDVSQGREMSSGQRTVMRGWLSSIDGRELTSNLPKVKFVAGRNLDPALDSQPDAEGHWAAVVQQRAEMNLEMGLGDILTFQVGGGSGQQDPITFKVVGVTAEADISAGSDANLYAPLNAFEGHSPNNVFAVADVKESQIKQVRRSVAEVPGTFVLETRFVNDLVNRIVDQFTSFPILVAILALFTGGFVIANSVALSTMERRREIGVMKAIGLQRERVLGMLLLENGLMGLIGGLIGVGISFVILVIILTQGFEGELGNVIPYGLAFGLMGLCIGISLVAAILSVWTASGEKPLNVLRYE